MWDLVRFRRRRTDPSPPRMRALARGLFNARSEFRTMKSAFFALSLRRARGMPEAVSRANPTRVFPGREGSRPHRARMSGLRVRERVAEREPRSFARHLP